MVWPTNILSTIGAWYSFVFFPQCVALEGVDNYPWCYLEWYRLSEHGLNMIMLGLDWAFGAVPMRRGDLGHTLVFMAVYTVWTWYLQFTWKVPVRHVRLQRGLGERRLVQRRGGWGTLAAFFLVKKAYDARGRGASAGNSALDLANTTSPSFTCAVVSTRVGSVAARVRDRDFERDHP